MNGDITKDVDIERIAREGSKIYDQLKAKYEPEHMGEFLAIDIDSGKEYLASTSAEALSKAREMHPKKVFYVAKIGFDAAETLAQTFTAARH